MPNRKEHYQSMSLWKKTTRKQKERYYKKRSMEPKKWTKHEEYLILTSDLSDSELSKIVGHGVRAIQVRRCKLKKEMKGNI